MGVTVGGPIVLVVKAARGFYGPVGGGPDGAITISANTTITSPVFAVTYDVTGTAVLSNDNLSITASTSISVESGASINANGNDAVGLTGGAAGITRTMLRGQIGANGGTGAGAVAAAVGNSYHGSDSGAGGAGDGGAGGAGAANGTLSLTLGRRVQFDALAILKTSVTVAQLTYKMGGGAGGSAGAGDGAAANGGGGGGGGNSVKLVSPTIDLQGVVSGNGGAGAPGTASGCGGGGGGSPGSIGLVYRNFSGVNPVVLAGLGGASGGGAGVAGSNATGVGYSERFEV